MSTAISRLRASLMVGLSVTFLGLMAVTSVAHADQLKQTMNDMKRAYRGAINSSSMAEFQQNAVRLQSAADAASRLSLGDNPTTYRQGMDELRQEIDIMNAAIKSNDLAAAKESLKRINSTRKHYHDLLG